MRFNIVYERESTNGEVVVVQEEFTGDFIFSDNMMFTLVMISSLSDPPIIISASHYMMDNTVKKTYNSAIDKVINVRGNVITKMISKKVST